MKKTNIKTNKFYVNLWARLVYRYLWYIACVVLKANVDRYENNIWKNLAISAARKWAYGSGICGDLGIDHSCMHNGCHFGWRTNEYQFYKIQR
jgi:hypothetical protein